MLSAYIAEIEERQQLIDGVVESANGEDLNEEQLELVTRAQTRIEAINKQMKPLEDSRRVSVESSQRIADLAKYLKDTPATPKEVEYRSAGEYVLEYWKSRCGDELAKQRLEIYQRAAAHQTTADNAGLIPTPILGPIVSFIDVQRPLVNALGARQLPGGSWSRPQVTQHTQITAQGGEKTELASRKMLITKVPVTPTTYGGYVNVSRQDMDWSQPQVMDIVINDLAAQYAIETETATVQDLLGVATAGPTLPTGTPTADEVAGAFWAAAGSVFQAVFGAGQTIAIVGPDMLSILGPLFPPINPFNAQSAGLTASGFGTGAVGSISGIPVYVTLDMTVDTMLVMSTAAAEVYEDRVGALQVVEPSVLGIQVAYAGYFANLTLQPEAIIKVVKTP
jgi:hypothetical protein